MDMFDGIKEKNRWNNPAEQNVNQAFFLPEMGEKT